MEDQLLQSFVATLAQRADASPAVSEASQAVARVAQEFINEHVGEALVVNDIACHAGVSVRGLQESFKRHLGTTPMSYLRDVRLDQIHKTLRSCDPSSAMTVTKAASLWGFGHLPRLAAAYRQRFGELPSQTLRGGHRRSRGKVRPLPGADAVPQIGMMPLPEVLDHVTFGSGQ